MTDLLKELEAAMRWGFHGNARDFLRTHHAEIADAVKDARRYRLLRNKARQNTAYDVYGNGGHWSVGFFSSDNRLSFDAAIDAMHNSAREAGE